MAAVEATMRRAFFRARIIFLRVAALAMISIA
jgi:hypothetical protein